MDQTVVTNHSRGTYIWEEEESPDDAMTNVELTTFIILLSTTVLGLLGNVLVIIIFLHSKKLRTPQNVFIINLAISDTITLISNGPTLHTLVYHYGERYVSDTQCLITAFFLCLAAIASIITMGAIAVTRYISIVHPSKKGKLLVWWKCNLCAAIIWLYSCSMLIPVFFGWGRYSYQETVYLCCIEWSFNMVYNVILFMLGFGLATVTILFCYVHIFKSVKNSKRRIQHFQGADLKKIAKESKLQSEEVRLAIQLLVIFLLFNICWLPYLLLSMFIDPNGNANLWLYGLFINLVFVNSAINPPLYLYYNKRFRTELERTFYRCRRGGTVSLNQASQPSRNQPSRNVRENGDNEETCV